MMCLNTETKELVRRAVLKSGIQGRLLQPTFCIGRLNVSGTGKRRAPFSTVSTNEPQLRYLKLTVKRAHVLQSSNLLLGFKRFESITSSTTGQDIPDSVIKLKQDEYRHLADGTLELISTDVEDFFEDKNILDADVENSAGIVSINTTEGTYVINKQPPNKQLWLSSPLSGPKRFDYLNGQWTCLRNKERLFDILQSEMNEIYGDFEFTDEF
ncbi:DEKNAAC100410 [Brettanomyces naardenensis]|uniref:ferroxidase n=1 Tax=Brettanomyces naardenensis TaxID=13370 RepID=A0A448YGN2_BRENA|nr:DEKNAAC100410 [Brettanomyces naardenensis]